MRILLNTYSPYSQNFKARSEESKKADYIQRRAKAVFPMASPSYAEEYYYCTKPSSKRQKRADEITKGLWNTVMLQRSLAKCRGLKNCDSIFSVWNRRNETTAEDLIASLYEIKEWKRGCCDENAKIALAVLCANGFYNSIEACMWCNVDFINKKSGKVEHTDKKVVPHCFAMTNFSESFNDYDSRKDIVVDPWLGFADYKGAAAARFKQAFSPDIDDIVKESRIKFMLIRKREDESFNINDYKIKTRFTFEEHEPMPFSNKLKLGQAVREKYPETIINFKKPHEQAE